MLNNRKISSNLKSKILRDIENLFKDFVDIEQDVGFLNLKSKLEGLNNLCCLSFW